jgi:hypothetical protein
MTNCVLTYKSVWHRLPAGALRLTELLDDESTVSRGWNLNKSHSAHPRINKTVGKIASQTLLVIELIVLFGAL